MMSGVTSAVNATLNGYTGSVLNQGTLIQVADKQNENVFGVEGLYSQEYSIGIFAFLVLSICIFIGIMYLYWKKSKSKLKPGEIVMFVAIFMGVVIAFVFGYMQMVEGYLF